MRFYTSEGERGTTMQMFAEMSECQMLLHMLLLVSFQFRTLKSG